VLVTGQTSEPFQILIPREPQGTRLLITVQGLEPQEMSPIRSLIQNNFEITEVTVAFSNFLHFSGPSVVDVQQMQI